MKKAFSIIGPVAILWGLFMQMPSDLLMPKQRLPYPWHSPTIAIIAVR